MTAFLDYANRVWRGQDTLQAYFHGQFRSDQLQPICPGVWMWPATGNAYLMRSGSHSLLFDSGDRSGAAALAAAVARTDPCPVSTVVYSHGHVDHVMGAAAYTGQAAPPHVIGHHNVARRFDRYRLTAGYNALINARQFGVRQLQWPTEYVYPDRTYHDELRLDLDGNPALLKHGRGETDDATALWLPEWGVLATGDFVAWNAPNAGNPQKSQRYVIEWAESLRWMAALNAEVLLPGHGVPIIGAERVEDVLTSAALLLERLHDYVLDGMNRGVTLDGLLSGEPPGLDELLTKPYLRATYDEPEFIIHNLWRYYGGWYGGDPATLKPPRNADLAAEVAALSGGADRLAERAEQAATRGELRTALQLVEWAWLADCLNPAVAQARRGLYERARDQANSFMAAGIYGSVVRSMDRAPAAEPQSNWAP